MRNQDLLFVWSKVIARLRRSCQNKSFYFWASLSATLLGLLVVVWFWIRGAFYENFINTSGELLLEKSAYFGDFIGGCVGVIFALVGVLLLFETLKLQREESTESRRVLGKQLFDSTFMGQLNLYTQIVSALSSNDNPPKVGKNFFASEMTKLQSEFKCASNMKLDIRKKEADDNYVSFYIEHKSQVAHYFRTLFRLVAFIDGSKIDKDDKGAYIKVLRA